MAGTHPPHFHAEYGGLQAEIDIREGVVLRGAMPFKQLKLVLAWAELHRAELESNWVAAMEHRQLVQIDPLR